MIKDQSNSIGKNVSIIYRYGQNYLSKKLESLNIGSGQYIFLVNLYKKPGISQEELSDLLRIDKATTAKAIRKLIAEGYVERKIDESDKRAYNVFLTLKGLAVIPTIQTYIKDWESFLMENLTEEEINLAKILLNKMACNAYQITKLEDSNEKCKL